MTYVGQLQSQERVHDRPESHIHPGVTDELLTHALGQIDSQERERIKETIDFGRIIGHTHCVATTSEDAIMFAQRVGREGLSRFVTSRQPEPTPYLTLKLHRKSDTVYELRTAYLGGPGEVEPWAARLKNDPDLEQASYAFWNEHALCWGTEAIIPGTETRDATKF